MSNAEILLHVLLILAVIFGVVVGAIAPIVFISQWILAPIDRVARFRKAPVRFSVGDFLCLFLAIQIPLAAIYRLVENDERGPFWTFTAITWVVAPVIWFAGARTLSKANVTKSSHRFVFLGLIMPLVYYGLIPFTVLGFTFIASFVSDASLPILRLLAAWAILAILFFISGSFVRWMLRQQEREAPAISDRQAEVEQFRAAMRDGQVAVPTRGSTGTA